MTRRKISQAETVIEYYQQGKTPRLLIHSGLHGDEYSIIPLVSKIIEKYQHQLPDFIFVPEVSPTAVSLKTRKNGNNLDINRSFLGNATDTETVANMRLVQPFNFNLLVSFHEDTEFDRFYLYDSQYAYYREEFFSFAAYLRSQEISLYTGIDDPTDPTHGFTVVNGRAIWGIFLDKPLNGTFDDWAIKGGIVERLIMPEIPTSLSKKKKEAIIEGVINKLILPFFEKQKLL